VLSSQEQMEIIKGALAEGYKGPIFKLIEQANFKKQEEAAQQEQPEQRETGGLVQSYESKPPSLEMLPTGDKVGKYDTLENAGIYKSGGFKKYHEGGPAHTHTEPPKEKFKTGVNSFVSGTPIQNAEIMPYTGPGEGYVSSKSLPSLKVGDDRTLRSPEKVGAFERITDILASPTTAFRYSVKNQPIPGNIPIDNPDRTVIDMVLDSINPFAMGKYARQVGRDLEQGNKLDAAFNTLGAIPALPAWAKKAELLNPGKTLKNTASKIANKQLGIPNNPVKMGKNELVEANTLKSIVNKKTVNDKSDSFYNEVLKAYNNPKVGDNSIYRISGKTKEEVEQILKIKSKPKPKANAANSENVDDVMDPDFNVRTTPNRTTGPSSAPSRRFNPDGSIYTGPNYEQLRASALNLQGRNNLRNYQLSKNERAVKGLKDKTKNIFKKYSSKYPTYDGDYNQKLQLAFKKSEDEMDLYARINTKGAKESLGDHYQNRQLAAQIKDSFKNLKKGEVYTGASSLSADSFLMQTKVLKENAKKGDLNFLGYKPSNYMDTAAKAGYSPEKTAEYLNATLENLSKRGKIHKNTLPPYVDKDGTLQLPVYGIKAFQKGGFKNRKVLYNKVNSKKIKKRKR
tara:strand:+ start:66 stop:1940 length:1875 start_codon:yes stop_codon:yes gene_type:complete